MVLEDNTQVWDSVAKVSQGSIGDQQDDEHGLLEKSNKQGNGKGEGRMGDSRRMYAAAS